MSQETRTAIRSRIAAGVGCAALAGAALCGCTAAHSSAGSSAAGDAAHATSPASSSLRTLPAPAARGTRAPAMPVAHGSAAPADLTAIVTSASASTAQVVQLHDLAVSAGHRGRIPAAVIPASARTVATTLRRQAALAVALRPAAGSPQAELAAALRAYATLTGTLTSWQPSADRPLASTFFRRLAATDAAWKSAMRRLGALAHRNLLGDAPTLLFPN